MDSNEKEGFSPFPEDDCACAVASHEMTALEIGFLSIPDPATGELVAIPLA